MYNLNSALREAAEYQSMGKKCLIVKCASKSGINYHCTISPLAQWAKAKEYRILGAFSPQSIPKGF